MESENILAVNIPNAVSILIMAIVGGLLLAMLRKAVTGKASSGNALASKTQLAPGGSQTQLGAY